MADLINVLPNFDLTPWRHLTYSLEKNNVSTAELIALDPIEVARRCPLPLKEVRRMAAAVLQALGDDVRTNVQKARPVDRDGEPPQKRVRFSGEKVVKRPNTSFVRTLDDQIDNCLGGGFPAGTISEIVGESAVGKTQFLLSLLLTAQLAPPNGLGQDVLYISTEDNLNTTRLVQMLKAHPKYQALPLTDRPNLDRIRTIAAPNLQKQELIVQHQLPEAVRRYNIGLVIMDSVAANFRAEYQGATKKVLSERAVVLIRLGNALRRIAHNYKVAVVVANQVGDRFDDDKATQDKVQWSRSQSQSQSIISQTTQKPATTNEVNRVAEQVKPESAIPTNITIAPESTAAVHAPSQQVSKSSQTNRNDILSLDFQQRFFTGWGDDPHASPWGALKTPSLGLAWANQLDARIVLKMSDQRTQTDNGTGNIWSDVKRVRHLKVVFASWTKPSAYGVEYELDMQGPVSLPSEIGKPVHDSENFDEDWLDENDEAFLASNDHELLDPKYWEGEDEEFP